MVQTLHWSFQISQGWQVCEVSMRSRIRVSNALWATVNGNRQRSVERLKSKKGDLREVNQERSPEGTEQWSGEGLRFVEGNSEFLGRKAKQKHYSFGKDGALVDGSGQPVPGHGREHEHESKDLLSFLETSLGKLLWSSEWRGHQGRVLGKQPGGRCRPGIQLCSRLRKQNSDQWLQEQSHSSLQVQLDFKNIFFNCVWGIVVIVW